MLSRVTAKNVGDVFLRHTVVSQKPQYGQNSLAIKSKMADVGSLDDVHISNMVLSCHAYCPILLKFGIRRAEGRAASSCDAALIAIFFSHS